MPPRRDQAFRRTGPERAARAASRARWQARYDEVRRRHLAGEPLLAIARAMGLARATARKFARAESFPVRLPHGPGPSILDPYLPHLGRRLAEGCENGLALWRELRAQGFPGGNKQVHRWLAERRTVPAKIGRPRKQNLADAATGLRVEQDGEAKAVAGLARRFTALVRACGVGGRQKGDAPAEPAAELDAWLAETRACDTPAPSRRSPPGWRWTARRCAPP